MLKNKQKKIEKRQELKKYHTENQKQKKSGTKHSTSKMLKRKKEKNKEIEKGQRVEEKEGAVTKHSWI